MKKKKEAFYASFLFYLFFKHFLALASSFLFPSFPPPLFLPFPPLPSPLLSSLPSFPSLFFSPSFSLFFLSSPPLPSQFSLIIPTNILITSCRNTFAFQTDSCICLCSRFYLIGNLTVYGINFHLTAKCSLRKCDRSC